MGDDGRSIMEGCGAFFMNLGPLEAFWSHRKASVAGRRLCKAYECSCYLLKAFGAVLRLVEHSCVGHLVTGTSCVFALGAASRL